MDHATSHSSEMKHLLSTSYTLLANGAPKATLVPKWPPLKSAPGSPSLRAECGFLGLGLQRAS